MELTQVSRMAHPDGPATIRLTRNNSCCKHPLSFGWYVTQQYATDSCQLKTVKRLTSFLKNRETKEGCVTFALSETVLICLLEMLHRVVKSTGPMVKGRKLFQQLTITNVFVSFWRIISDDNIHVDLSKQNFQP